jgi:hypothetical protein
MKTQNKKQTKKQNPLYVVKGDQVEEADGLFDMLFKKFNLGPVIDILNAIFKMLVENIKTYAVFVAVSEFFDLVVDLLLLFKQFSIL